MEKTCDSCGRRRACHSIYYRLGHAEGPSLVSTVLIAFGVPIVVFVATLSLSGALLAGNDSGRGAPTLVSFTLALALTALVVLSIWRMTRKPTGRGDGADEVQR
ncbi:MAG: hypothetical protein JW993_02335 [Sedimentisphaerales bacterium]|nr:hypothetical protein [Sedimentisphaerales bacterium]